MWLYYIFAFIKYMWQNINAIKNKVFYTKLILFRYEKLATKIKKSFLCLSNQYNLLEEMKLDRN